MKRIRGPIGALACAAPVAAATAASAPTTANAAASSCTVGYSVAGSWNTGFQGGITITNNGAAIGDRTLTFVFPGNQQITGDRDGALAAGASTSIGFTATVSGAGEMGENDCADTCINPLMTWLDSEKISYLAWTWNNWDRSTGPVLITDHAGDPTEYGVGFRAHLLSLG